MTYINHRINNDMHHVETLGAFATRAEAAKRLALYRETVAEPDTIYLSRRSTRDYFLSTGAATPCSVLSGYR